MSVEFLSGSFMIGVYITMIIIVVAFVVGGYIADAIFWAYESENGFIRWVGFITCVAIAIAFVAALISLLAGEI